MTIDEEALKKVQAQLGYGWDEAARLIKAYEQAKKPAVCQCLACRGEKQHTDSPTTSQQEARG
jgi:hypothetical protein